MPWHPSKLTVLAAVALTLASGLTESMALAEENTEITRPKEDSFDKMQERYERAVMKARHSIGDKEAPALTAMLASNAARFLAVFKVDAEQVGYELYSQLGIKAFRKLLSNEITKKYNVYDKNFKYTIHIYNSIMSGHQISDNVINNLNYEYHLSLFELDKAKTELILFDTFEGPRRKRRLAERLQRATDDLARTVARCQSHRARLQHTVKVLKELFSSGSALMGELLEKLKADLTNMARTQGLTKKQIDGQPGRIIPRAELEPVDARDDLVKVELFHVFQFSAQWLTLTFNLAKSLVVCS